MDIQRQLVLDQISNSCFLFGARQVGKTWLLKNTVKYDLYIDLLDTQELVRYIKAPELLLAEIKALNCDCPVVVIDEIQKAPNLLNEVHRAMESANSAIFILTGSSARKLKRNHANMLGGRALTCHLFPLSYREVRDMFSLESYLQFGGIPNVFLAESRETKKALLESYVNTYLKEEIYEEALTRNLPAFTRFLELAGAENGNIISYTTIAREIGVSSKVVKEYFSIVEDTLIGFFLPPFFKSCRKRIIGHSKFYFHDTGIVFALKKMLSIEFVEATRLYGDSFEHFIILEVKKAISYLKEEINMSFFRTFDGTEVDLILEKHGKIIPIEIKSSTKPLKPKGLKSFLKDHVVEKSFCVCRTPRPYKMDNIDFIPYQDFLNNLYSEGLF